MADPKPSKPQPPSASTVRLPNEVDLSQEVSSAFTSSMSKEEREELYARLQAV
jgi:hypothetical protein